MISLNRKHELFRQYKNGIVTFDHYNYSFKNNFTTTLRLAKNSYFQRKFTECSNNSRYPWKTLDCLIQCKKTSKDVTLNHNGQSISDPSAIAEIFNSYFSNIASNLDSDIPHLNISPLYFLRAPVENLFFCPPSDSEEIVNLIRRQKNKSTDLMNIPEFIYKILAPVIAPIQFHCSLITHCLKVFFQNSLKRLKLFLFSNLVTQIRLRIIDLFPCYHSCQKCSKNRTIFYVQISLVSAKVPTHRMQLQNFLIMFIHHQIKNRALLRYIQISQRHSIQLIMRY